ncbi:unnamed protein product [Adineta steineri]|uniref:Major facilitator superfamily (MFS) profile domain-containing protein n=1 Tax=Adineta steineri TaxID=433720 RepID=A0A813UUH8_9BILA|nr:unnamed protein product [Adineta steineri]CAF0872048.1 unnamed protein product [Adineta steineri]
MESSWAVSIYFIGFMVLEIPSNFLMRIIGPSKFLSIIMIVWGIIMISMAFIHNATGLLITRFLLGAAQAGFFPGIIFYFSLWYIRKQHSFRMAIFYCGVLLSGAFGGILAYAISLLDHLAKLQGWQWIFIVEGAPSIPLGIVTYFFLGDLPETVQWLTNTEKEILTNRLREDPGSSFNYESIFSWQQVRFVFTDWKIYLYMFMYVGNSIAAHCLIIYLPTLINNGMKFSNANAQLMSAPPHVISCVSTLLISFSAGRFNERGWHMSLTLLIGIIGYILLITLTKYGSTALYIATCITCVGTYSPIPLIMSWFTNNIGGHTKRAVATAFIIGFGNISGIVVGHIYRKQEAPFFIRGHLISLGFMCSILMVSLILKLLLSNENRRRDNLAREEYEQEVRQCGAEPSDSHPDFRYTT